MTTYTKKGDKAPERPDSYTLAGFLDTFPAIDTRIPEDCMMLAKALLERWDIREWPD